jgi:hypothetical protein
MLLQSGSPLRIAFVAFAGSYLFSACRSIELIH